MANVKECEKVGVDPKKIDSITARFERLCREADKIGVTIFCGSSCSLRYNDGGEGDLILSHLCVSNADGGAGDCNEDEYGYIRGEFA